MLFFKTQKPKKYNRFTPHDIPQTLYNRNKMLLEKAQEETDGSNPGKSSLKATLTEQIKEQEAICSSLKEVPYQLPISTQNKMK